MTSPAEGKAVKDKKRIKSRSVKSDIFTLLLKLQLEETRLNSTFTLMNIYMYYLILAYSVLPDNTFKTLIDNWIMETASIPILFFSMVYWAILILNQVYLYLLERKNGMNPKILTLNIQLSWVYSNIISPMKVVILSRMIARSLNYNRVDAKLSISEGVACAVGILVLGVYTVLLDKTKSDIPSNSPFAFVSTTYKSINQVLLMSSQIIAAFQIEYGTRSTFVHYLLWTFTLAAITSALLLTIMRRMFWDASTNNLIVSCGAKLVSFKLFTGIFRRNFESFGIIFFLIFQSLASRLAVNVSVNSLKVDVFRNDLNDFEMYVGIILMNKYLMKKDYRDMDDSEREMYYYYSGIWLNFKLKHEKYLLKNSELREIESKDLFSSETNKNQGDFSSLISFLLSKSTNSTYHLKLLSLLQVRDVKTYFRSAHSLHSNFRQANGTGFFEEFESFQLKALWEYKIQAMERGSIETEKVSSMNILDNFQFLSIILEEDQGSLSSNLDLRKVFESIKQYDQMSFSIESILHSQVKVFETLHEGTNVNARLCMEMNKETLLSRRNAMEYIKMLIESNDISSFYSFFYPTLIFYFSQLQFEVEKSDHFVLLYKKKLNASLYKQQSSKSKAKRENYADCVVIHCSLAKETLGLILETSLNFNHYLGDRSVISMTGQNISSLVLPVISETHLKAIETNQVRNILNKQREVIMVDMKSNIKNIKLNVKISPSISEAVSCYNLIDFDTYNKGPSLILDKDLNIIGMDSSMNKLVQYYLEEQTSVISKSHGTGLESLSKRFATSLKLVERINSYFEELKKMDIQDKKKLVDSENTLKDRLFSMLSLIVDNNNSGGLMYNLERGSGLQQKTGRSSLHSRFEFCSMLGVKMVKAFISRRETTTEKGEAVGGNVFKATTKMQEQMVEIFGDQDDINSDDVRTNKAVREHFQEEVQAVNSEQKSSLVHARNRNNDRSESSESIVHNFEDLIFPTLELMEFASKKPGNQVPISVNELIPSVVDVSSSVANDRSFTMADTKKTPDSNLKVMEIIELIKELKRMTEENPAKYKTAQTTNFPDKHTFFDEGITPRNSKIESSPFIPKINETNKHNQLVPLSQNFKNPSQTLPSDPKERMKVNLISVKSHIVGKPEIKVSLQDKIKEKPNATIMKSVKASDIMKAQSRMISKSTTQANSHDIIAWMKNNQTKKLGRLNNKMKRDMEDSKAKGTHPNVASFLTIGLILSYFKVSLDNLRKEN